jgi:hypothetical protein
MKMRDAEGDGEIAVEQPDPRRRTVGVDLPRRALNDRPEDDFTPVIFE